MTRNNYRDLAEFGLPFVTPEAPKFRELVREIQGRPSPFGPRATGDLNTAAVLLNQSGRAIVVLAYIWRFTMADGRTRTSRYSNLGSSMQMEVLAGQREVSPDQTSFILPGSTRLITQEGIFGDNSDVLPPELVRPGGSFVGSSGRGGGESGREEIPGIELELDVVFFDDGLCVGPDDFGLFESVTGDLFVVEAGHTHGKESAVRAAYRRRPRGTQKCGDPVSYNPTLEQQNNLSERISLVGDTPGSA